MSQPTPSVAHAALAGSRPLAPAVPLARRAAKVVAASISAGTGLVTIFAFARSYGLTGAPEQGHLALGGFSAAWVGVTPAHDTATAILDTLHLVATAKDSRGSALVGAPIRWTSDDPAIATVDAAGAVVARAAGTTTIAVTVGDRVGRARVVVAQRPAALRIAAGDTVVGEGEQRQLRGDAVDAHGYPILAGAPPVWRSADSAVATVDSAGTVTGVAPGRATIEATLHGMTARAVVAVRAVPGAVAVLAGADQRAPAGARLAQPVVVRVVSTRGRPVPGATVRFTATGAGARAEPTTAVSDAEGRARSWWTLGGVPGRQRLLAAVDAVDSAVAVVADAEPSAANLRATVLGGSQAAAAGEPLPAPVGLLLTDSLGRPLADVVVTWLAPDGGLVAADAPRTDSLGRVAAAWTLGPRAGAQQLRAFVGGGRELPPAVVAAAAQPGPPAALVLAGGAVQRGTVARPLARGVTVRVRDRRGNPVAGAMVAFDAAQGTVADPTLTTDSTGAATTRWTLGPQSGTQWLAARVAGLADTVALSAEARPAAAASVAFDSAAAFAAVAAGRMVPVALVVTDAFGNPVAGARLRLAASTGTVAPAALVTDAVGRARARWTPRPAAGRPSLLTATVAGGPRATLAVAGTPAQPPRRSAPGRRRR